MTVEKIRLHLTEEQLLTCPYCGSIRPDSTELFLHEMIYHVNKGEKLPLEKGCKIE